MKKTLFLLLKIALVGVCVFYLVRVVDFARLWHILAAFHPGKVVVLVAWFVFALAMLGLRLWYLSGRAVSIRTGFDASVVGMFVNTVLPARLGEAAKAWLMHNRSTLSLANCFGAVFWERFADLNIFLVLLLLALFAAGVETALLPVAAVVGGLWVGLLLVRKRPEFVHRLIRLLPGERLRLFVSEFATQLEQDVRMGFVVGLSFYTLLVWTQYVGETLLAIFWLADLDITLIQGLIVFVLATTGIAVPSSPGGLGVFEAIFVFALGMYDVPREEALATALLVRAVQLLPTFALGGLFLLRSQIDLKTLREKI